MIYIFKLVGPSLVEYVGEHEDIEVARDWARVQPANVVTYLVTADDLEFAAEFAALRSGLEDGKPSSV